MRADAADFAGAEATLGQRGAHTFQLRMQIEPIQPMLCADPLLHKIGQHRRSQAAPWIPPQPLDHWMTDGVDGTKVCRIIGGDAAPQIAGEVQMGSVDRNGCIAAASIASDGKAWHASFKSRT